MSKKLYLPYVLIIVLCSHLLHGNAQVSLPLPATEPAAVWSNKYVALARTVPSQLTEKLQDHDCFMFGCAYRNKLPDGSVVDIDSCLIRRGINWGFIVSDGSGVPFCVATGDFCVVADSKSAGNWLIYKSVYPKFEWYRSRNKLFFTLECTPKKDDNILHFDIASLLPSENSLSYGMQYKKSELLIFNEEGLEIRTMADFRTTPFRLQGLEYKRNINELVAVHGILLADSPLFKFPDISIADVYDAGIVSSKSDATKGFPLLSVPPKWISQKAYKADIAKLEHLVRRD